MNGRNSSLVSYIPLGPFGVLSAWLPLLEREEALLGCGGATKRPKRRVRRVLPTHTCRHAHATERAAVHFLQRVRALRGNTAVITLAAALWHSPDRAARRPASAPARAPYLVSSFRRRTHCRHSRHQHIFSSPVTAAIRLHDPSRAAVARCSSSTQQSRRLSLSYSYPPCLIPCPPDSSSVRRRTCA